MAPTAAPSPALPDLDGLLGGASLVLTLFTYPYVYLPVAARLARCRRRWRKRPACSGGVRSAVFRTVVLPQITGAVRPGRCSSFLYVLC